MPPPPLKDQRKTDEDHLNLLAVFHFVGAGLAIIGIGFIFFYYKFLHILLTNPASLGINPSQLPPSQMPPPQLFAIFKMYLVVGGAWFALSFIVNVLSGIWLRT